MRLHHDSNMHCTPVLSLLRPSCGPIPRCSSLFRGRTHVFLTFTHSSGHPARAAYAAHHVSPPPASYRTCTLVLSVGPASSGPSSCREAISEVWRGLLRISTAHARPAPELHSARAVENHHSCSPNLHVPPSFSFSSAVPSPNTLAVTWTGAHVSKPLCLRSACSRCSTNCCTTPAPLMITNTAHSWPWI